MSSKINRPIGPSRTLRQLGVAKHLGALGLISLTLSASAATLQVPSQQFPTVKAAHAAAASGDTIEIATNLMLEAPPVLLSGSKQVFLRSAQGSAVFTLNTPPANDEFVNASLLLGPSPLAYGANYAATTNPWDPLPESAGGVPAHFGRSVWWRWTAPSNGVVIATTLGSSFAAFLDVFYAIGAGPAHLPAGDREWYRPNEVGFQAYAGTDYAIQVGGDNGAFGELTLQLSYIEAPTNDAFTNALAIAEEGDTLAGTSLGASREPWEPNHAGSTASSSVWFRWTAPLSNSIVPYPVRITTAGSDFDTVLAVYTNSPSGGLLLAAANDDRPPTGTDSRVSFSVVPGLTYFIALDGGAFAQWPRDRFGSYVLRLDPSLVDLRVPTNAPVIDPVARTATFSGQINVRDYGLVGTAPLQVRVFARAASDLPGIHRNPVTETNLLTIPIAAGLNPNENRTLPFTVVCPAPQVTGDRTNFWGVFALLEEEFGGSPVTIDKDFLGYGDLTDYAPPILSWPPGRPLPPTLAASEVNSVGSFALEGPPYVTEQSTNQFFLLVRLSPSGRTNSLTSGTWSATPLPAGASIGSTGLLRVGPLSSTVNLTLYGTFALAGRTFPQRSATLPLYKKPRMVIGRSTSPGMVQLRITDDTRLSYLIEVKTNLASTSWAVVQTIIVTNPSTPLPVTLPAGPAKQSFFRLRATP
jgi:hypothetical protein